MSQHAHRCCAIVAIMAVTTMAAAQDRLLHERTSDYNRILVSEDASGLRTLRFREGGSRQSVVRVGDPEHLELPYARVMPVGLAAVGDPQRMLIVGLGGGTLPGLLHRHYPQAVIDVVEIDAAVVDVARQFFGFREDAQLRAFVDDGRRFIEAVQAHYDIIFLDAFDSDSIPFRLATREFLMSVREALSPGGVVVANIWSRSSNALHDSMVRTYQDVFPDVYVIQVRGVGNEIILGLPATAQMTAAELAQRAARVSQVHHFRYDMGPLVEYGLQHVSELKLGGEILLDRDERKKAG